MKKLLLILAAWFSCFHLSAKQSLSITFQHEGLTMNGRLVLPDGNGPYTVIILNPGTGANDKDGTIAMNGGNTTCLYPGLDGETLTPYKDMSDALSDAGYAVLTYDKVEYTHTNPGTITFRKLWLPVESAIAYLKTRTDIAPNNIILMGHSEGSTLIPYISRRYSADIRALVSLAGPRAPLDSLLAMQLVYIANTCGGDVPNATQQANAILDYFNEVRKGTGGLPPMFGVPAGVWKTYMTVADSVSINYNLAAKPTLFVGMGNDINVPASELARLQNEVTVKADFYGLSGFNHYMNDGNDPRVSKVVRDTVIQWLKRNVWPVSVKNIPAAANEFSIAIGQSTAAIAHTGSGPFELIITDIYGRNLHRATYTGNTASIALDSYATGIYILTARSATQQQAIKFVR